MSNSAPNIQLEVEGDDGEFGDDFGDLVPIDPARVAWGSLARGEYRRDVADKLGISLARLNTILAEETTRRIATRPSVRERIALIETALDVATVAACEALDEPGEADPEMLRILVDISRLRLQMLTPKTRTKEGTES